VSIVCRINEAESLKEKICVWQRPQRKTKEIIGVKKIKSFLWDLCRLW
jgi:hypothetical protein